MSQTLTLHEKILHNVFLSKVDGVGCVRQYFLIMLQIYVQIECFILTQNKIKINKEEYFHRCSSVPTCSIVYKSFLAQLASCSKQPNYWVKPWLSVPRVLHCILHPSQAPESFLSALHQCHLHLQLNPGLGCLPTAI